MENTYSNPLDSFKSAFDTGVNTISNTYNQISDNISQTASVIVPIIKKDFVIPETNQISTIVQEIIPQVQKQINQNSNLNPFEKQMEPMFMGCYSDDPTNPSMEKYLGEVSNTMECIELGRKNNFNFIGLQQGNKCFASNKIPTTKQVDRQTYCNVGCDDVNTGNCGGFFYNQVYRTTLPNIPLNELGEHVLNEIKDKLMKQNTDKIIENFIETDVDVNKINYGLNHINCDCWKPIDSYALFTWIVVIVILLFILVEYINKKLKTNK